MNIPIEVIQKIQCLYIGCEVITPHPYEDGETLPGYLTGIHGEYRAEVQHLENGNVWEEPAYHDYTKVSMLLTPLSMLTDEDAIEVANALGIDKELNVAVRRRIARGKVLDWGKTYYGNVDLEVVDFLRSRRYALPAFGYTVDQLVEAGIFLLKTPNNEQSTSKC